MLFVYNNQTQKLVSVNNQAEKHKTVLVGESPRSQDSQETWVCVDHL